MEDMWEMDLELLHLLIQYNTVSKISKIRLMVKLLWTFFFSLIRYLSWKHRKKSHVSHWSSSKSQKSQIKKNIFHVMSYMFPDWQKNKANIPNESKSITEPKCQWSIGKIQEIWPVKTTKWKMLRWENKAI